MKRMFAGDLRYNMPLLYGEGSRAFVRLQEEIMRSSTDLSILAWEWVHETPEQWPRLLAEGPSGHGYWGGSGAPA